MSKSETRTATLKTLWGEIQHPRIRYRCHKCQSSHSQWADPSLDNSHCSPLVLSRTQEFALHVPYRTAQAFLHTWGVNISSSQIADLSRALETSNTRLSEQHLEQLAGQALPRIALNRISGLLRLPVTWMLEVDGTLIPTRVTDEDGHVRVEYREIKSAVLYQKNTPSERYQLSVLHGVERFTTLLLGLLRFAGVSQADCLVGLSDGAVWIANVFADTCVNYHVLDVFHASSYLETLMLGLGWNEPERSAERCCLQRGQIDLRAWLNVHVRPEKVQDLTTEPLKALQYLERQTELLHTTYPKFKALGLEVIGSGEIEGANKSVIGSRLKVSGAQWSTCGAHAKSFARGMWASQREVITFDQVRFETFPRAA
jgi:hypothetical protein